MVFRCDVKPVGLRGGSGRTPSPCESPCEECELIGLMKARDVVDDLELVEDGEKDMVPGLCEKA